MFGCYPISVTFCRLRPQQLRGYVIVNGRGCIAILWDRKGM